MSDILSHNPFLLALIGSLVIEFSATLVRRAAQTLAGWLWYLAGALSAIGMGTLLWSLIWANTPDTLAPPQGNAATLIFGPLLVLVGVVWIGRAVLALGRQTLFAWPATRVIRLAPYRTSRRPMVMGFVALAAGLALTTVRVEGWIWLATWFVLSQPLLELEEWELRARNPEAASYFDLTPRYFRLPGR